MKYNFKEIKTTYSNKLIEILIEANNLGRSEIEQLFSSEINLSTSKADCVNLAIERIKKAKENNEMVFIGGDYDADGICATTILKDALDKYGINCGYYIPDRFSEGYGLNSEKVEMAHQKGYSLIITVDNGVKAYEALDKAKELGIDVIVSDHHLIEKKLDNITVHPDFMEDNFKGLCGAGVALQLARNLIGEDDFQTALAGIATIGDLMVLFNENRSIVKKALRILNEHKYRVFDLLLEKSEIEIDDIAFVAVPKLNSLGRLADKFNPNNIIRYFFLSKEEAMIQTMAKQINEANSTRKDLSKKMGETALSMVKDEGFIIVKSENFHEGIVGLVAGKLANTFNKPTIVLSEHEGILKGSGRSIIGFDLHEFLAGNFNELLTFGGHSQAVALSLETADYEDFYKKVIEKFKTVKVHSIIDVYKVSKEDLSIKNVKECFNLFPLGQGVKLPLLAIDELSGCKYQLLKGIYPKYNLADELEAICFDTGINNKIVNPQMIIGSVSLNNFRGKLSVSLNIKDIE